MAKRSTIQRERRRRRPQPAKQAAIRPEQAESPDEPAEASVFLINSPRDLPSWCRPGWRPLQPGEHQEDDRPMSAGEAMARALATLGADFAAFGPRRDR